ncbi:vascular endothelial growth factor receptor 1 isoform X2 [Rhinatrema bivittatum]|uniref:vascular endothelial growth factor receptor 1 isoform X2 n=1 Tax=Rhinatrema bivittatum TaxID=194408 RepID=UPI001127A975|nr:vascular endothelial growth factor receptor 1 isoform X2 [Rhinatrema bivittatum]
MLNCATVAGVCLPLGCLLLLLLTGSSSALKVKAPELNVKGKQHIIQVHQPLHLTCRGEVRHSWSLPETVNKEVNIKKYACGRNGKQYCSSVTLRRARASDTGYYSCKYLSTTATKKNMTESTIYIFINDTSNPFVEMHNDIPKVVYMMEKKKLIIPCRVTAPNITVTLKKIPRETLIPDQKTIIWDSRKGFIIPKPTYKFVGLLSCETTVNGHVHSTKYITHRQVHEVRDVQLNVSNTIKLLRGETLAINCTVTANWNTRVYINWSFPGEIAMRANITRRINQHTVNANIFYSILVIDRVQVSDKGEYTCHVESGPLKRSVNTTVDIYEKAFITVKPRKQQSMLEVMAGKKSYHIAVKVKAFPLPEVIWLKDDLLAAEKCARYIVNGYSLIIKDVSEEDAGNYTIVLRIQQWNLSKSLTVTLTVNVKPQIYEKAVSFQDPTVYPVGSKQVLTCTAYGVPPPIIKWIWHPCGKNRTKVGCDFHSKRNSFVLSAGNNSSSSSSNTRNRIQSISERMEIIKGKNKTVGILVVAESRVSGVFSCVASSKVGKEKWNINFYVTDVPNGFYINLERDAMEGNDVTLSCLANKYLYTDVTWLLMGTVDNQTIHHNSSRNSFVEEYSLRLTLNIRNATQEDSGTYACKARNIYTGEEVLQQKELIIRAQQAPHLLRVFGEQQVNLSSSVSLECQAEGVPEPQISWYKNGRELQQESGILLEPRNNRLIIERIKEDDAGLYLCRAANPKGSAESSAYITVQGTSEKSNLELITLTCTCVAATLFWLLLTLFIRKLKRPSSAEIKTDYLSIIMDPEEVPLDEQCERLPYDASKWEFPRERLQLGKSLGRGAFGKVVQASAFGMKKSPTCKTVAVKMLKEGATASEYKALMTELKILIHIGHHLNVVNLLGACTRHGGPLMVVVEYCKYGNLSNYLKSKREFFFISKESASQPEQMKRENDMDLAESRKPRLDSIASDESLASSGFEEDKSLSFVEEEEEDADEFYKQPITMEDLISYSFQVARGMEFLSSRKCIHRDLAARNILLSENNVVKICDFGLARDIYKDPDYVRKGDARLPLKWMAPESIFDKIYTTKSDVWSYGVLLWEIFSLGASPYPGVQIDEDFCNRLKEGTRMRAPDYASPEIYQTMLDCWHGVPKERPQFSDLVEKLGDLLQANVQQDGKDYIPLNTILPVSSNFACSSSIALESSLNEGISTTRISYENFETCRYINTYNMNPPQRVKTFEELSPKVTSVFNDYQADSGMVLASEELKRFTWTGSKSKHMLFFGLKKSSSRSKESVLSECARPNVYHSSCGHINESSRRFNYDNTALEKKMSCCAPPPAYNSVVSYSTAPS